MIKHQGTPVGENYITTPQKLLLYVTDNDFILKRPRIINMGTK